MRAIPLFLLWCLYFIITLNARGRYMQGCSKGHHCVRQINHLNSTEYVFKKGVKPYREYRTWREWWKQFGYYKN